MLNSVDDKIISIIKNYKPKLIICGHNNILSRKTIIHIKNNFKSKIIIWYEDALAPGGPDYQASVKLLEKNHDLIDRYFVTILSLTNKNKNTIKKNKFYASSSR